MIAKICNHQRAMTRNTSTFQRQFSNGTSTLLISIGLLSLAVTVARGDPISELSSFSIFNNVDLAQLAKSDVKTAHGPPMKTARYLAVQSCYVAPGSPAQQMQALKQWDPTKHRE